MNNRLKIILGLILAALIAIAGLAWYLGFFASEPEEASVEEATAALAADEDPEGQADSSDGELTDLAGTWTVEASEATYVGYRVNEVLSTVGEFTAVGRTALVEGTLEAEGLTITNVSIAADLRGLTSNSSSRDRQLRSQALETDTFPDGVFTLTSPIEINAIPADGELFETTASGDLTIHGQTQPVQVAIQGTVQGNRLIIVGSMDILMSDFGITPPSAPVLASIEDRGVMELSLIFGRS